MTAWSAGNAFVEAFNGRFRADCINRRSLTTAGARKCRAPFQDQDTTTRGRPLVRGAWHCRLAAARPFLFSRAKSDTHALWLADTGEPYGYIGKRIPLLTKRLIGMNVPPHSFRDALATTIAGVSPELARGTKAVLGYADIRTSERHYNRAQAIKTVRSYSDFPDERTSSPEVVQAGKS